MGKILSKEVDVDVFFNGYPVGVCFLDASGNECYYREDGSLSVTTLNKEPSLTEQHHKDSCDVNKIVARFMKTGLMTNVRKEQPMYGDFTNITDYHTARLRIQEAEESFMTLPAQLRARFENDPGKLIDFLSDSNNRSEAVGLGLIDASQATQVPQEASSTSSKEGVVNNEAIT